MNLTNIRDVQAGFAVLNTTQRSQTAVMILSKGEASSKELNVHQQSDQTLLLLEGELQAEIGKEKRILRQGDSCIVEAGTPHRFKNLGPKRAVTFNVYSPPEYPPDEKD